MIQASRKEGRRGNRVEPGLHWIGENEIMIIPDFVASQYAFASFLMQVAKAMHVHLKIKSRHPHAPGNAA